MIATVAVIISISSCSQRMKEYFIVKRALGKSMEIPSTLVKISGSDFPMSSRYKMVSFVNAAECEKCYASTLPIWSGILGETVEEIPVVFIFEKPSEQLKAVLDSTSQFVILSDSELAFRKLNKYLEDDIQYDTFLLDSSNTIVLRGNPLFGDKILKMYLKVLSEEKYNNQINR